MEDAQVAELLKRAVAAVEGASVPEDLRATAFAAAFGALSGQQTPASPSGGNVGGGAGGNAGAGRDAGRAAGTGSAILDAIAAGLGLDGKSASRLFADKNGEPELIVATRRLPDSTTGAARDISLLVAAARQLSGLDDYTEVNTLRGVAKRYGKFDTNNFSKSIKALDNYVMTQGKGAGAKIKLTHPGMEAAVKLAQSYAAEGKEKE